MATDLMQRGESTMRKMSFARIAGALFLALGVLAPPGVRAQEAVFVAPNGNVGIGTATPNARLHLFSGATGDVFLSAGPDAVAGPAFNIGYGGVSFGRGAGFLNVRPDASATAPNPSLRFSTINQERMIITNIGSVGIGTSSPSSRLHVNGGDIRVSGGSFIDDGTTLNSPDYVFEPGYDLMPLDELQMFIAREKHLPNVPSAREVKEGGLNLSQFQMRLLEKIEELTLHTLALHDENVDLKARLAALEGTLTPAPLLQP
jgi:hypothetical protein